MAVLNYAQVGGTRYDFADGANVAPAFSSSTAYAVGDYVINPSDGLLYQFTTAHAAGAWDSSHVTRAIIGESVSDLKSAIQTKADKDGSYEFMTVGNAEQLVSTVGIEDSVPYLLRTTGGSADVGDRVKLSNITGGTVAWNQLIPGRADMASAETVNGVTYQWQGQVCTLSGQLDSGAAYANFLERLGIPVIAGHKYLCVFENKSSISNKTFNVVFAGGNVPYDETDNRKGYRMFVANTTGAENLYLRATQKTESFTATARLPMQYDLTQMFGSTIADYLYALETSTAGAGIAQLKAWGFCTKPYYAYDAGSLQSVKTTAHREVGFNQWDEEWEVGTYDVYGDKQTSSNTIRSKNYIPILPSTTYHITIPNPSTNRMGICWYNKDKSLVYRSSANTANGLNQTSRSDAYYMTFYMDSAYGTTYNHDICINLHWDGERDGEYEPYEEHTYPLDDVELRGIPKLDANNNLYYDGDTYEADGTVTRKYGIVDLGTLGNWSEYSGYPGLFYLNVTPSGAKIPASNTVLPSLIANGYIAGISRDIGTSGHTKGEIALATNRIYISNDTYAGNASGFRTAISGVYLVYELATPTTEEADPYQETQICNDFGIEEFVDTRTVPIPVGYTALYQPNLRAKLEMAPDSPSDGDGDYIVRQTNGENAYVKLVIPTELPTAPTEDGTYHLKCTVASGTATLSWESDT